MSCVTDTESIALTVTGGDLTADLILDPDPSNAADVSADGLFVSGANETGWFATGETWTSLGADAPNYTVTIIGDKTAKYEAGMRAKVTQGTDKYFIIVAVAYDGGTGLTTLTLYGGTDYSLTGAAITASYYSVVKKPLGFPADPAKWTVELVDVADRTQASPTGATWYNLGSLSLTIPIGAWDVYFECVTRAIYTASGSIDVRTTLSTGNNSQTDTQFSAAAEIGTSGNVSTRVTGPMYRRRTLVLAAKTQYFLNAMASGSCSSILFTGSTYAATVIRAVSAYL